MSLANFEDWIYSKYFPQVSSKCGDIDMESQFSQSLFSMLFTLEFGLFSYIYLTFLIFLERFIIPLLTIENVFVCCSGKTISMALIGMHLAEGVQSPGPVESIVLGSLKQEHIGKILEETKDLSQSVQDLLKLKPGTEQMKLFIEEVFNITKEVFHEQFVPHLKHVWTLKKRLEQWMLVKSKEIL